MRRDVAWLTHLPALCSDPHACWLWHTHRPTAAMALQHPFFAKPLSFEAYALQSRTPSKYGHTASRATSPRLLSSQEKPKPLVFPDSADQAARATAHEGQATGSTRASVAQNKF